MTESQRRTHLIAWLLIGPLALAIVGMAIAMRPAPPGPVATAAAETAP